MGIEMCLKMALYGSVPGMVKNSLTFMKLLKKEGHPTIRHRI